MKQPPAFFKFADACLAPMDMDTDHDGVVDYAFGVLTPAERREVRAYLVHLLEGPYSDTELRDIWRDSPSGFIILEGIRGFFESLVDRLGRPS